MNIFVLSHDPLEAAEMHCDIHVNKMLSETAQMICTAIWPFLVTDFELSGWKSKSKGLKKVVRELYKERTGLFLPSHSNHPCTRWCAKSRSNLTWLYQLGCGLEKEWRHRKGDITAKHRSAKVLHEAYKYSHFIKDIGLTPFAQAFVKNYPHLIDLNNPIEAYRNFYVADKHTFAKWNKGRSAPDWYIERLKRIKK